MSNRQMMMGHSKKHKKGAGKKKIRNMSIRPAQNGGFVVSHSHENDDGPMYQDDEEYAMKDAGQMHDHVAKHFPAKK